MNNSVRISAIALALLAFSACSPSNPIVPVNGESIQNANPSLRFSSAADELPGVPFTSEQQASIDQQSKCTLRSAALYLEGLSPNQPLGYCSESGGTAPEQALRGNSGIPTVMPPSWINLSILKDGERKQIQTFSELQAEYAPVESAAEAYSFVLLKYKNTEQLTENRIKQAVSDAANMSLAGLRFETDSLEGTKMIQNADGSFSVTNVLFDAECNGNDGTTKAYAIDYRVLSTGEVQEIKRKHIYSQPCAVA